MPKAKAQSTVLILLRPRLGKNRKSTSTTDAENAANIENVIAVIPRSNGVELVATRQIAEGSIIPNIAPTQANSHSSNSGGIAATLRRMPRTPKSAPGSAKHATNRSDSTRNDGICYLIKNRPGADDDSEVLLELAPTRSTKCCFVPTPLAHTTTVSRRKQKHGHCHPNSHHRDK